MVEEEKKKLKLAKKLGNCQEQSPAKGSLGAGERDVRLFCVRQVAGESPLDSGHCLPLGPRSGLGLGSGTGTEKCAVKKSVAGATHRQKKINIIDDVVVVVATLPPHSAPPRSALP